MKIEMTVFYEDGTSGVIEFEKPAGAHPDSISALTEGVRVAEGCGKRVQNRPVQNKPLLQARRTARHRRKLADTRTNSSDTQGNNRRELDSPLAKQKAQRV